MKKWIQLALKKARGSDHPFQQVGAVVVRGGAVLASACNTSRYGHCAEVRALGKVADAAGATVYVARRNRRFSRPCGRCQVVLRARGVRDAVYANPEGLWIRERVG